MPLGIQSDIYTLAILISGQLLTKIGLNRNAYGKSPADVYTYNQMHRWPERQ